VRRVTTSRDGLDSSREIGGKSQGLATAIVASSTRPAVKTQDKWVPILLLRLDNVMAGAYRRRLDQLMEDA
jgi:hypothetical protein